MIFFRIFIKFFEKFIVRQCFIDTNIGLQGVPKVVNCPELPQKRLSRRRRYPMMPNINVSRKRQKTTKTIQNHQNVIFPPFFGYLSKFSKILSIDKCSHIVEKMVCVYKYRVIESSRGSKLPLNDFPDHISRN